MQTCDIDEQNYTLCLSTALGISHTTAIL